MRMTHVCARSHMACWQIWCYACNAVNFADIELRFCNHRCYYSRPAVLRCCDQFREDRGKNGGFLPFLPVSPATIFRKGGFDGRFEFRVTAGRRRAFDRPVEMDEAYVGGKPRYGSGGSITSIGNHTTRLTCPTANRTRVFRPPTL